ncbi:MAG TPA: hypothetical protein VMT30_04000 [Candidatus Saccharimonadia bacterium]|nr:hypothetical protein [Candidatus Saccharimonadia bacterium]
MSSQSPASEATKNDIENTVNWYLADKLQDPVVTIATKKYLTNENRLVYLTHCNVAETAVPRIKVQVLERVEGGVQETGYQIFSDHRMTKYENAMIFGNQPGHAADRPDEDVTEQEAADLVKVLGLLTEARQTL